MKLFFYFLEYYFLEYFSNENGNVQKFLIQWGRERKIHVTECRLVEAGYKSICKQV